MSDTTMMGDRVRFPTTSWNLVQVAKDVHSLDRLIQIYWKPLYFFVRQHGYDNEKAKDAVQGFFTSFLEKGAFSKANKERGRFRTFLLVSLNNYLKDWAKAESRQKRGGDQTLVSLDFASGEAEYALEVAKGDPPEIVLNRAWAKNLWRHALSELRAEPAHLEAFKLYLADKDYKTITEQTSLSDAAAKSAVHRLKGQLRDIIVGHIRETVTNEDELKAEVAEFMDLLS